MTAPLSAPIDMEAFEKAIHTWFTSATGLETIWRDQSAPRAEYPYASLSIISGPDAMAPQWEQRFDTDLIDRDAGEEVRTTICVPCRFTVSCQAYVSMIDARNPLFNARHYMTIAQSSLSLPSVLATLWGEGIAVERSGPVQTINQIVKDAFVSRANLDVVFATSLSMEEFTGYIEKAHITCESMGIDDYFGDV